MRPEMGMPTVRVDGLHSMESIHRTHSGQCKVHLSSLAIEKWEIEEEYSSLHGESAGAPFVWRRIFKWPIKMSQSKAIKQLTLFFTSSPLIGRFCFTCTASLSISSRISCSLVENSLFSRILTAELSNSSRYSSTWQCERGKKRNLEINSLVTNKLLQINRFYLFFSS